MEFIAFIQDLFSDYTSRTIILGTIVLGVVSGTLGTFAVLRKQSLLGDAISHASLPGIAVVFLIIGFKDPLLFMLGAIGSGVIGTLWIRGIQQNTAIKSDTALGIILTVFFGLGIVFLTYIQRLPNANQAGLDSYLFGQAATLMMKDVVIMSVLGGISLLVVFVFWKEQKLLVFDTEYAQTLGFNTRFLDILMTSLIVVAIVLGLQTVGVVLMSAMIIAPAAAARQWTNRLWVMIVLAAIFGALAGVIGTAISTFYKNMATGPVIVLAAVLLVALSFFFAPNRGLLFSYINTLRSRKTIRMNKTLTLMYQIARNHDNYQHPHSFRILNNFKGYHKSCIRQLSERGYIKIRPDRMWELTGKGYREARDLYATEKEKES